MRHTATILVSAVILSGGIAGAGAQDYPGRAIRIVVPVVAGGSPDILARLIGGKLHERWGQPVIVDNRAGAGQMIGADLVAKAPPDGHTLLLPTVTYTTSAATRPNLPFDPLRDLAGVTLIGEGPFLLVVHPSLPVKSVREVIALAKSRPGSVNYASSGSGSILHLITEIFASGAGVKLVHVPYKSIAPAVTDVVGGHVPMMFGSLPSVLPQVKAGRLRALAVSTPKRSQFVPHLPSVSEAGLPGYEARQWWGLFAPGKTSGGVIAKLNGEVHRILAAEDVKARLADEGAVPVVTTPEAFTVIVRNDIAKWRKVVEKLGIKAN